jgi:surface antigen
MRSITISAVVALGVALGACAESYGPKQTGGTLVGAGLGGLAGAHIGHGTGRLVAVGAGTLLGALLGSEVGRSLDKADQVYAERASQQALETAPSGTQVQWRNPDSGHEGWTTPQRTYQTQTGQYCREFTQTVMIGGRQEQAFGTACRQPDGTWKVVS